MSCGLRRSSMLPRLQPSPCSEAGCPRARQHIGQRASKSSTRSIRPTVRQCGGRSRAKRGRSGCAPTCRRRAAAVPAGHGFLRAAISMRACSLRRDVRPQRCISSRFWLALPSTTRLVLRAPDRCGLAPEMAERRSHRGCEGRGRSGREHRRPRRRRRWRSWGSASTSPSRPRQSGQAATHLSAHGIDLEPEAALDVLDACICRWLAVWDRGNGFAAIRTAWLERAGPEGENLAINAGGRPCRRPLCGARRRRISAVEGWRRAARAASRSAM